MASPFSIHQQQLAILSQQQSIMGTAAKPNGGSQAFPVNAHQFSSNGLHFPAPNFGSNGHQVPGMVMPVADLHNHMQVCLQHASTIVPFPDCNFISHPIS